MVPFSMAIGNEELMHECFPIHSRMGTARIEKEKKQNEGAKTRGVSMEISKTGSEKEVPTAYHNLIEM